ncbi:MAG: hypothetical protein ACLS43_06780 [Evtepia gabavorous]
MRIPEPRSVGQVRHFCPGLSAAPAEGMAKLTALFASVVEPIEAEGSGG